MYQILDIKYSLFDLKLNINYKEHICGQIFQNKFLKYYIYINIFEIKKQKEILKFSKMK